MALFNCLFSSPSLLLLQEGLFPSCYKALEYLSQPTTSKGPQLLEGSRDSIPTHSLQRPKLLQGSRDLCLNPHPPGTQVVRGLQGSYLNPQSPGTLSCYRAPETSTQPTTSRDREPFSFSSLLFKFLAERFCWRPDINLFLVCLQHKVFALTTRIQMGLFLMGWSLSLLILPLVEMDSFVVRTLSCSSAFLSPQLLLPFVVFCRLHKFLPSCLLCFLKQAWAWVIFSTHLVGRTSSLTCCTNQPSMVVLKLRFLLCTRNLHIPSNNFPPSALEFMSLRLGPLFLWFQHCIIFTSDLQCGSYETLGWGCYSPLPLEGMLPSVFIYTYIMPKWR